MGTIIRRTVRIIVSENWTITWTTGDAPHTQTTTTMQQQPKTEEDHDETILPAVKTVTSTDAQTN